MDDKSENSSQYVTKEDRELYLDQLRKWLDSARLWQNVSAGFPYYYAGTVSNENSNEQFNNITHDPLRQAQIWHQNVLEGIRQRTPGTNNTNNPYVQLYQTTFTPAAPPTTYEFVIAPLWKRVLAECLDCSILITIKLILAFLILETFNFMSTDIFQLEELQKNLNNPELFYPALIELLTVEFFHRFIVTAYEVYFLKGNLCATPGKSAMGIMVITVDNFTAIPGRMVDTISATGARPMGLQKALTRSTLKNVMLGFVMPLVVLFYIYPHNRTGYDMTTNTIVVENHPQFLIYNSR